MEALATMSKKLDSGMPIFDRAQALAGLINTLIEDFDKGTIKEGVGAVQQGLIQCLVD